jgi:hypothetical protein
VVDFYGSYERESAYPLFNPHYGRRLAANKGGHDVSMHRPSGTLAGSTSDSITQTELMVRPFRRLYGSLLNPAWRACRGCEEVWTASRIAQCDQNILQISLYEI